MKRIIFYLLGILISFAIPIVGLGCTKLVGHGAPVLICLIATIPTGILVYRRYDKSIGIGILTGLIPLAFLTFIFIMASNLH